MFAILEVLKTYKTVVQSNRSDLKLNNYINLAKPNHLFLEPYKVNV